MTTNRANLTPAMRRALRAACDGTPANVHPSTANALAARGLIANAGRFYRPSVSTGLAVTPAGRAALAAADGTPAPAVDATPAPAPAATPALRDSAEYAAARDRVIAERAARRAAIAAQPYDGRGAAGVRRLSAGLGSLLG
jgi:hypothetical protein